MTNVFRLIVYITIFQPLYISMFIWQPPWNFDPNPLGVNFSHSAVLLGDINYHWILSFLILHCNIAHFFIWTEVASFLLPFSLELFCYSHVQSIVSVFSIFIYDFKFYVFFHLHFSDLFFDGWKTQPTKTF